jgi:hypothetical protein
MKILLLPLVIMVFVIFAALLLAVPPNGASG